MKTPHLGIALLAILLFPRCLPADSIWDRRSPQSAYLFVDNRARQVGDLLTIVVRETTDVDHKDKRAMDKQTEAGGVFNFSGKAVDAVTSRSASANLDTATTSKRTFDSRAEFTSERGFTDRMTVTVIDVLPNGNLLIEGKRRRVVTGEDRTLLVSGMVRPDDIGAGNIVQSQFIANFQIAYEGNGPESSFTNQDWFARMLNHAWPF